MFKRAGVFLRVVKTLVPLYFMLGFVSMSETVVLGVLLLLAIIFGWKHIPKILWWWERRKKIAELAKKAPLTKEELEELGLDVKGLKEIVEEEEKKQA